MKDGAQLSYALIRQVTWENNGRRWRYVTSKLTEPYIGACIRIPCGQDNLLSVTFQASYNGDEQLLASPLNRNGIDPNINWAINYRFYLFNLNCISNSLLKGLNQAT